MATGHHCVLTVSGGTTAYLLVDGVLGTTATGGFTSVTEFRSSWIGRLGGANGFGWSGSIDEVAVWSTAKYTCDLYGAEFGLRRQ